MQFAHKIKFWRRIAGALVLGARVLFNPKDIRALLGFGDLISDTEGFRLAAERLKSDPVAREVMSSRYSQHAFPLETLPDYPAGTLGAAFHAHMTRHGLSYYPTRAHLIHSDAEYMRERVRETHDILHAVLGYDISVAEEAGLNAFLMAQFAPPISTLIVAGAIIHTLMGKPKELPEVLDQIFEGYALGKSCRNAMAIRWEEEFGRPLMEVRRDFGLKVEDEKPVYTENSRSLRTARIDPKYRERRARLSS